MKHKKIFIVRHAKAEDNSFVKEDFYRVLTAKGQQYAEQVARTFKLELPVNSKSLFLSSSATRAIQTARIFANEIGYAENQILQNANIYEAHFLQILKEINKITADVDNLVVFGHNPGLSDLTNYLCNSNIQLQTASVAIIRLEEDFSFSELSANSAYLERVLTS